MKIENKVAVTICGKEYNLRTDDSPEYLIGLAKRVDKEISDMVKAKPNFGIQNAAVFVALTALDEAQKASQSIDNVGKQIKSYVEETAKARKEKEKLADKNKALEEKIAALEKEIKELKKRPAYECEQLVLENTISPAVMIYAEENTPESIEADAEAKTETAVETTATAVTDEAAKPDENTETAPEAKAPEKADAKTAECGSDASKGSKEAKDSGEHGGADGGAGTEAQNDGGNTQNDNVTAAEAPAETPVTPPAQNKRSRKKRH